MAAETIRCATTKASSGHPPGSEIRRSKARIRRKVSIRSYAFLHGQGRGLLRRRMKCGNICISFTVACAFLSRFLREGRDPGGVWEGEKMVGAVGYSSQLLSPMGVVRIMIRIMARVVMMAVVRIITTKVEWIGIVIEVRVWVIIWLRVNLPL